MPRFFNYKTSQCGMFYNWKIEPLRCFIIEKSGHWSVLKLKNRTTDQVSKRNRMFYNWKFMHTNARDMSPSKPFCFIIEYTPYIKTLLRLQGCKTVRLRSRPRKKMKLNHLQIYQTLILRGRTTRKYPGFSWSYTFSKSAILTLVGLFHFGWT